MGNLSGKKKKECTLTAHFFLTGEYNPSSPEVRCHNVLLALWISYSSLRPRTSPKSFGRNPLRWVVLSLSAVLARSSMVASELPSTAFGVWSIHPFVDVVLTASVLSFSNTIALLGPSFDKYSEYSPAGNVIGDFAYVLFLFSACVLLMGESATTFRSKDCGNPFAQRYRLVCIQDIRSYSRESRSSKEQRSIPLSSISPDPYSPPCVLCASLLTHCAAYVSLSIYPPVPWPLLCCSNHLGPSYRPT